MIKAEVVLNGTSDSIEFEGTMEVLTKELVFLIMVMARRFYADSGRHKEAAIYLFRSVLEDYITDDDLWQTAIESARMEMEMDEEEEDENND